MGRRLRLAALAAWFGSAAAAQEPPTFARDVAPIVHRACAPCHRPGQPAPFQLLTYADVFKKRSFVADVTARRYMPPWQPTAGDFVGDRRLGDAEIATLLRWVDAGAPRGDEAVEPAPPKFAGGWQLGEPDLVLTMPDELQVPADGPDLVRNFVVPAGVGRLRYVAALEIRPGNRAVHHAVLGVDRTAESRRRDERDAEPGFAGMSLGAAAPPDGHFLGWTPGKSVRRASPGMAWRLWPGDDLVLQLHAVPVGKPERVRPQIGLWFTDEPTRTVYDLVTLFSEAIDIAPGQRDFVLEDHLVLPVAVTLHALYPHAHYVCRRMRGNATLPGGEVRTLFAIDAWDFDWQDDYELREPMALPAGTRLAIDYRYDNSEHNPNNPLRPLRRVRFGQESADEMGTLTLSLTLRDPADRPALQRAIVDRELEKVPGAWNLLVRKARLERERGQLDAAALALARAREISPGAADVFVELGLLAEQRGRLDEAGAHYREALQLDPGLGIAHLQLGAIRGRAGDSAAALSHFTAAVAALPNSPLAHNNLATAYFAEGRLDRAELHYRRAVALDPDYFNAWFNLGRVLLGLRRMDDARAALERAAALRPDSAPVRELLQRLGG